VTSYRRFVKGEKKGGNDCRSQESASLGFAWKTTKKREEVYDFHPILSIISTLRIRGRGGGEKPHQTSSLLLFLRLSTLPQMVLGKRGRGGLVATNLTLYPHPFRRLPGKKRRGEGKGGNISELFFSLFLPYFRRRGEGRKKGGGKKEKGSSSSHALPSSKSADRRGKGYPFSFPLILRKAAALRERGEKKKKERLQPSPAVVILLMLL